MVVKSDLRILKEKLKEDLAGFHILEHHVYFRYSILNYIFNGDFMWDYKYKGDMVYYFTTTYENVANLLARAFPEIEIILK